MFVALAPSRTPCRQSGARRSWGHASPCPDASRDGARLGAEAIMRKYVAEAIGTFGVVLTGCGAALVGGARLGDAGVALAFGAALASMLFATAPLSGGHLNPAVTLAMAAAGRLRAREIAPYVAAQLAGGAAAA